MASTGWKRSMKSPTRLPSTPVMSRTNSVMRRRSGAQPQRARRSCSPCQAWRSLHRSRSALMSSKNATSWYCRPAWGTIGWSRRGAAAAVGHCGLQGRPTADHNGFSLGCASARRAVSPRRSVRNSLPKLPPFPAIGALIHWRCGLIRKLESWLGDEQDSTTISTKGSEGL